MACEVKVVEDSINPVNGVRLTTIQLRFWRPLLSQFNTHRVFSRNASSSRATPISRMIKQVWNEPAGPIYWGVNQAGMSATTELTGWRKSISRFLWFQVYNKIACGAAWLMSKIGVHKQVANRILEPWQYISVIVTSTEWDNFFELRDDDAAQPEIRELAQAMRAAMAASKPVARHAHLPYITTDERLKYTLENLMSMSTARCARVSYLNHEGKTPSYEDDMNLYQRLVVAKPMHASSSEHACIGIDTPPSQFHRNLRGWYMHRIDAEKKFRGEETLLDAICSPATPKSIWIQVLQSSVALNHQSRYSRP